MKRLLLFASCVLALVAAAATPAGAGAAQLRAQASPLCASQFSSLGALRPQSPPSFARGTKDREPRLRKGGDRSELDKAKGKQGGKDFRRTIPVYVHVITDGENGHLSRQTIEDQITILNLAFSGFYGGVETGFRFRLKKIDRTDNARWFNVNPDEDFEAETEMKRTLKRGKPHELDLYTTFGNGYLGYAYFPDIVADPEGYLDGVVVDFQSLPGGAYGESFSLGQTATHEVGHWVALWHTFDNSEGCVGIGDEVEDTPFQSEPTGGCPEGKDSCPALPGLDPIRNYMDYSFDSCYDQFTAGQTARMQSQYLHWRDHARYVYAT